MNQSAETTESDFQNNHIYKKLTNSSARFTFYYNFCYHFSGIEKMLLLFF